mmetsp:Transcript_114385/g.363501  ORF Transcript_114385/g.363501 Transcript_114385/m.363501 type:complete len:617 (+) Transcript_114385:261-2111(+)|eukprot:CAMPEP_0203899772 /NCGR_PEP_ID=MMETSP0359-20131031/42133_1 /ASSEMBLY_ACC=CAM_ASM_000338 /TAXON_ID=268821 /ORGANISM="Scrippsiella Hangoei, Strain SHTV-5" /LENGTH=616 /DNA_ID=CAMNT_0050823089 /DNA_START=214 /DNA_END=2064 /DNA_ORIENTATION=+
MSASKQNGHQAMPLVQVDEAKDVSLYPRGNEYKSPSCVDRWRFGYFTIVPDGNPFIDLWDILMIIALLATAFVVPYEVALVSTPSPGLAAFDLCVNAVFIIDMVLTFNLAFTGSGFHQGQWVREPLKIARHYMAVPFSDNFNAGWFWPDLITVLPWERILTGKNAATVRMVRVVRLLRMFRLVRVLKLFVRGHTKYGFSFALVRIVRCLFVTLMFLHWLACIWAHLGLEAEMYAISEEGDCWLSRTHLAQEKPIKDFTAGETYRLALYFCVVVLTTVGFGDISPVNHVETIAMTITVFLTGLTWAWVVANVVGVIGQLDMFSISFNQAMDDLNTLMAFREVDKSLQIRVRKHMHEAYHVHQSRHHWEMIQWLSPMLQGELAVCSGKDQVCNCIWYFRGLARGQWLTDLVLHFVPDLFSADETIMDRSAVSVIRKGSCAKKGKILTKDAIFGEDMILATEALKDTACPRTLTIVESMKLSRYGLREVCERHDAVNLSVRRAQIKLAVCRALVLLAQKLKRREDKGLGWDVNDFKALAQTYRGGFVQHSGAGIGTIQIPPNPALDQICSEIQEIGTVVQRTKVETQRRFDALSKKIEQIDKRTDALEHEKRTGLASNP